MTSVAFELHRIVDNDVVELDEAALAGVELRDDEPLDGALVFTGDDQPRVAIIDDLRSAVQRLCFMSLSALLQPGEGFGYLYFTSGERAQLDATDDAVAIHGGDVPDASFPRTELVLALYGCGLRYLEWAKKLGRADDLRQLGPHADQARDTLRQAGLI